jgi:hypothetical protein
MNVVFQAQSRADVAEASTDQVQALHGDMSQPNLNPDHNVGKTVDSDEDEPCCVICFGTFPVLVLQNCGCPGASGLSHVQCIQRLDIVQDCFDFRKNCRTCKQPFTGKMRRLLDETFVVRDRSTTMDLCSCNYGNLFTTASCTPKCRASVATRPMRLEDEAVSAAVEQASATSPY